MVLTRMKKLLCICLLVLLCLSGTAQGQPALNEPVYLMVHGQLMEQLQVLHSGPRTCIPALRLKSRKRRMSCSACRCPISIIASSRPAWPSAPCAGSIAWLRRQANPASPMICSRQGMCISAQPVISIMKHAPAAKPTAMSLPAAKKSHRAMHRKPQSERELRLPLFCTCHPISASCFHPQDMLKSFYPSCRPSAAQMKGAFP